jgi:hypothetical protein
MGQKFKVDENNRSIDSKNFTRPRPHGELTAPKELTTYYASLELSFESRSRPFPNHYFIRKTPEKDDTKLSDTKPTGMIDVVHMMTQKDGTESACNHHHLYLIVVAAPLKKTVLSAEYSRYHSRITRSIIRSALSFRRIWIWICARFDSLP